MTWSSLEGDKDPIAIDLDALSQSPARDVGGEDGTFGWNNFCKAAALAPGADLFGKGFPRWSRPLATRHSEGLDRANRDCLSRIMMKEMAWTPPT